MKIKNTISVIAIALITGLIMSCSLNPAEEDPKPIIVNFTDPNFEALIRENLEIPDRDITNQDMWSIQELNGDNRNISNLTGIEYCSGLHTLKIQENNINDLEPLRELVLLNYLSLQNNQITDIKPLAENVGLGIGNDIIYIFGNPLNNESILIYTPQLQSRGVQFYSNAELSIPGEINFADNNFEMVIREHLNEPTRALLNTDLETITSIYARDRNISNIYGIEFCKNLDTLNIGNNGISDLIPLFYLRNIESLSLDNNNIVDISPLKYFYYLAKLVINNNSIKDISNISYLTSLTTLILNNNIIQDISPLSNLLNLQYLSLSNNPIENFESLNVLDSLNGLELMDLAQIDIDYIKDIHNLQSLFLTNTPIINLDKI